MKILILFFLFCSLSHAETVYVLEQTIGDETRRFVLEESKIEKARFQFFNKKAKSILKMKSQEKSFCLKDYVTLEEKSGKSVLACIRSKEKISKDLVKFSSLVQLQFGK